jgi:hypothetical protein
MLRMEREIIGHMQEGNRRGYNDPMLVPAHIRVETEDRHRELNAGQRQAVEEIFLSVSDRDIVRTSNAAIP